MPRNVGAISVTVDADTGRLVVQLREAGRRAGRAMASEIDDALGRVRGDQFLRRIIALREAAEIELSGIDVEIGAAVDNTELRGAITEIKAIVAAADADVDIGADVDIPDVTAALAPVSAVNGPFGNAGKGAGGAFSSGFSQGMGAFAGIVLNSVQPAAVAVEGILGAAVAVTSSAMSALFATAGAAVPIITGLGTGIGVLAIGLDGMSDALAGNEDALARLTPEAREFVEAMEGIRPVLDGIRRSIQERLFAGLADELRDLSTTALPEIGRGLEGFADSLNMTFTHLGDFAERVDWEGILEGLLPSFDAILRVVESLTETFVGFLDLAAPAAERLAEALAYVAAHLKIALAANGSDLQNFLDRGLDSLAEWAELTRSIGDALITLFAAGQSAGDSFVGSLAESIERFDTWMESVAGQNALAGFFERARQVMADLAPVAEGLIGFFDRIITPDALERFGQITDIIGDLLPVLGSLFETLGDIAGPALTVIGGIADTLALFAAAWEAIPDPLKEWGLAISTGTVALKLLADVLPPLIGWLDDLRGAFDIDPPTWLRVLVPAVNVLDLALGDATDSSTAFGKSFAGNDAGDKFLDITRASIAAADALALAEDASVDFLKANKPVQDMPKTWLAARNAVLRMNEGLEPTQHQLEAVAVLTQQYGIDAPAVYARARAQIDETTESVERQREEWEGFIEGIEELATKLIQANDALADIAGTFEQIGVKQDALSSLFELGNAPRDAAGRVRDIEIAIEDLSDTAEDVKIGDILAGNVAADEVLDAIDDLRPEIQSEITDAFAAGGPEAAVTMAQDYIEQVADELGVSEIDAAKLLNLENIEATIDVAVAQSSIDNARRQLEILTGLRGDTPFTASIALALDAGTITGDQAQALIQPKLDEAGVSVPTELQVPTDPGVVAAAEAALAGTPVQVPTTLDLAAATRNMTDPAQMEGLAALIPTVELTATLDTTAADSAVEGLHSDLDALDDTSVAPTITADTSTALSNVTGLQDALDALHDETVTVTVDVTGDSLNIPIPGGMAGALVHGPRVMRVGERHYREAIVPLDLPLNRISPDVRQLAALLRGEGTPTTVAPAGPRNVINQQFTLASADPGAVATQVINRMAAAASR